MIKVTDFRIDDFGDPSVGIFPSFWEIQGEFFFDDEESFKEFKKTIRNAWELVCADSIHITYNMVNE